MHVVGKLAAVCPDRVTMLCKHGEQPCTETIVDRRSSNDNTVEFRSQFNIGIYVAVELVDYRKRKSVVWRAGHYARPQAIWPIVFVEKSRQRQHALAARNI